MLDETNAPQEMVPTSISDTMSVNVICFDFALQLLSLLQYPTKMTQENLVIEINEPLSIAPTSNPNKALSEV